MNRVGNAWQEEAELPSWTAVSATRSPTSEQEPPPPANKPSSNKPRHDSPPAVALAFASGALLVGGILGGVLLFSGQDQAIADQVENQAGDPPVSDTLSLTLPEIIAFDELDGPPLGSGVDDSPADSMEPPEAVLDEPPPVVDGETYTEALFSGGIIYLRGRVPSEEIAAAIVQRASAVMGPDNVVNEYVIDPTVPFDPNRGAPLYVEDLVLFESNSSDIGPQFIPLLDLGIILMLQNPQVTITVIGHTDATGDEATNLALSQRRVQSVIDYWVLAGIDPQRVTAIGKGEASPIADNSTVEGRRYNRRVEFIITGLLAD